jgi:hypothetical protein
LYAARLQIPLLPEKSVPMAEKTIPFVVTDRRKFTLDGEPRQEFQDSKEERERHEREDRQQAQHPAAETVAAAPAPEPESSASPEAEMPPPPTEEQMEQSRLAFDATADRLDTAIRAANPGMEHAPQMSFERLVQSVYMTAIMQLGGADESRLIDSALFELRMGFLEITQALARSAAAKNPGPGAPGTPRPGFGPSIVR